MTRSKARSSKSAGAPAAAAISALEGSLRNRPSGRAMSGSFASGPALASRARPSSESARQKACGAAQRSKTSLSSKALPDHVSPTMWTVCGMMRRSRAHSSRKLDTASWNTSSRELAGLST